MVDRSYPTMFARPAAFPISQYNWPADILDRRGRLQEAIASESTQKRELSIQVSVPGDSLRQRDAGSICVGPPWRKARHPRDSLKRTCNGCDIPIELEHHCAVS